jgi:hypothetical protein
MESTTRTIDRNMPSNAEAEQAVLGSLLLDPDAITRVASFLSPPDFYLEKHGWIYETILGLHEEREPIDLLTVTSHLESRGKLPSVGGTAYLAMLVNSVPTAIHIEHYAHLVETASVQRQLIQASTEIAGIAYEGGDYSPAGRTENIRSGRAPPDPRNGADAAGRGSLDRPHRLFARAPGRNARRADRVRRPRQAAGRPPKERPRDHRRAAGLRQNELCAVHLL